MMKILVRIALVSLLFLLSPINSFAVTYPAKPSSEHYYVDEGKLIDEQAGFKIDSIAAALLSEEKIPFYVVTISSLAHHEATTYSIEEYAAKLFNKWGIGWQDRNYGILLLVSARDRKARIELGAGWGRNYDSQAQEIMSELIIPAFKRGEFGIGIADGARGLDALARGLDLPKPSTPWWLWPALIGGTVSLVLIIVNLFRTGRSGWAWALIIALGIILIFALRVSSRAGGFGGGSSGGGGATGSW